MIRSIKITLTRLSYKTKALILSAFAIVVMISAMIGFSSTIDRSQINAVNGAEYVRGRVTAIREDFTDPREDMKEFSGNQLVEVIILEGTHKGEKCEVRNANGYHMGAYCRVGMNVILLIGSDGIDITGTVYNYDRSIGIYILIVLFFGVLCIVGGKKGVSASIALIFTIISIIFLYVPLLYIGGSPIMVAVIVAFIDLTVSILLINSFSWKALCAIMGTMAGVLLAGSCAWIFGKVCHVSGYNVSDIESLVHIANYSNLKLGDLLFSGILLASLGAVMDVSVSIASALEEVKKANPEYNWKRLFLAGMNVGRDMMGTMTNTLILAFVGGSIETLIIVYAYQMPYLQIISQYEIIIEIIRGLSATIGVVLTVPIEALVASKFYAVKMKK